MKNHTELLNALIEKHDLKSYLEIGVQYPENNFDKIKCDDKIGLDPALNKSDGSKKGATLLNITSDEWFETNTMYAERDASFKTKFDIIFIDGLHHYDQVKRDFENSLHFLNDNGFIVIHDCLPENEAGTKVPRETKVWWGDVYKFAMTLKKYDGIRFKTINMDEGCCVVWKDASAKGIKKASRPTWNLYKTKGPEILNVVESL